MKLSHPQADIFVPEAGLSPEAALARTTHLAVVAHQDDIEIMAYHGIAECFGRTDKWFSGVVVTDGAGSPRTGLYADYTDADMLDVRRREQRKAAYVGEYSIQLQLAHPSAVVKQPGNAAVQADLTAIFAAANAEVVYLHQPADKHDTHIAVLAQCLQALRALPPGQRPQRVLGCEVWRDLDWMIDADKQVLDVGAYPNVAASVVGVFDSQISGGKRYDLATAGRRLAHATYHTSHATDKFAGITWAIDLTPLVNDPSLSLADFTVAFIDRFKQDVVARVTRFA
ncbi:PIG-L family deacetylase [Horticoccus luteus]|uniref:PIG-L family deacetylase n=1 Tax=Horticoccus luteus TaxID=2862869 RepID=A0A8F9TVL4_9BACT|nr:PIG-L family deacetylase [Horticoccus luteus]QYM78882.1 PIG-L family deacetylase [Horticoccus luteus]